MIWCEVVGNEPRIKRMIASVAGWLPGSHPSHGWAMQKQASSEGVWLRCAQAPQLKCCHQPLPRERAPNSARRLRQHQFRYTQHLKQAETQTHSLVMCSNPPSNNHFNSTSREIHDHFQAKKISFTQNMRECDPTLKFLKCFCKH